MSKAVPISDADLKIYDRVLRRWYAYAPVLYFFFGISMLGAVTAVAGICRQGAGGLRQIPEPTLMMFLGAVDFALFFPLFLASMVTRYFMRRLDLLEARFGSGRNAPS